MKRGQQKGIPAPGQQQRHHVYGAYSWRDDTVTWTTAKKRNSEHFIAFLEHLLLEHLMMIRLMPKLMHRDHYLDVS